MIYFISDFLKKSKSLLLIAIFIFGFIALSSADCLAKKIEGLTLVKGNWVSVTVECGEGSYYKDGTLYMEPPWTITYPGGNGYNSGSHGQNIFWRPQFAKISIFNNNNGLHINDPELFDISVCDIYGKELYFATDKTDIVIDKNTMSLSNGSYMLRVKNKNNEFKFMKFIFINDSFIISEPHK